MSKNEKAVSLADELLDETSLDSVAEDEVKEEKKPNRTAKKKDAETVTIRLPFTKDLKEPMWVSLNGKPYMIKRGVDVEVPVGVAKIIRRAEKAELAAVEYSESMAAPEDL